MKIIVWNEQGAADSKKINTVAEGKRWLKNTWSDLKDLRAEIQDEGEVITAKETGNKTWNK